jgi:hypothetical protein
MMPFKVAGKVCISEYTNTLVFYNLNIVSLGFNWLLLFMQHSNCKKRSFANTPDSFFGAADYSCCSGGSIMANRNAAPLPSSVQHSAVNLQYKAQRAGSLVENSSQSLISPIGATQTFIDTVY